jgi:hypothetical protein
MGTMIRPRAGTRLVLLSSLLPPWLAACAGLLDFDVTLHDADEGGTRADGAGEGDGGDVVNPGPDAPSPGSWCRSQDGATLCDDFDEDGVDLGRRTIKAQGGILTRDEDASTSPPKSLFAVIQSTGPIMNCVQYIVSPTTTLRVHADVRVEMVSDASSGDLILVQLQPAPNGFSDYQASLRYTSGQYAVSSYAETDGAATGVFKQRGVLDAPLDNWQHVVFELTLGASSSYVGLYAEDGGLLGEAVPAPAASPVADGGAHLCVGIVLPQAAARSDTWQTRVDNVAVTVGP